jgi:hypothetical protein
MGGFASYCNLIPGECSDPDRFSQPLILVLRIPLRTQLAVGLTLYPPNVLIEAFLNRQCDNFRSFISMYRLDRFF